MTEFFKLQKHLLQISFKHILEDLFHLALLTLQGKKKSNCLLFEIQHLKPPNASPQRLPESSVALSISRTSL